MTYIEIIKALSTCQTDEELKDLFRACKKFGHEDSWSDDGLEFAKMHYAEGATRRGINFIDALIKAREVARDL